MLGDLIYGFGTRKLTRLSKEPLCRVAAIQPKQLVVCVVALIAALSHPLVFDSPVWNFEIASANQDRGWSGISAGPRYVRSSGQTSVGILCF